MRRTIFLILIALLPQPILANGGIYCVRVPGETLECYTKVNLPIYVNADQAAINDCVARHGQDFCFKNRVVQNAFQNRCAVIYANPDNQPSFASDSSAQTAVESALAWCNGQNPGAYCRQVTVVCDGAGIPLPQPIPSPTQQPTSTAVLEVAPTAQPRKVEPQIIRQVIYLSDNNLSAAVTGFLVALLLAFGFLFRHSIANWLIHGNLPIKLTNYADDIEVLFKRTQRVNWYGRVVFGIVARLGMTDAQLGLVRRYWLGRVIAFDSLRRQRQNKLAAMHLQLAARARTESKDAKVLSQIWAAIKTLFLIFFYLLRSLFSFLFGFIFIRVTIAKLVRGKLIESADLVLILQAKEAIEQSARYLKEYLVTAETFTGQEELFEPERSVDTVLAPLHRRGQTQP
jgi:hypothetical protein